MSFVAGDRRMPFLKFLIINAMGCIVWASVFVLVGYLGLHLTIGVLLIIGASWLFGGFAEDVVAGTPLTIRDKTMLITAIGSVRNGHR